MKHISAWIFGLSFLLLTACSAVTTYPPAAPLPLSDALYQSSDDSQLAIAIDASGVKHITRVECLTSTGLLCRVIYETTRNGGQIAYHVYAPVTDYTFRNPDVAVTDSGLAIVTWQNCPSGDPDTRLCSTWFMRSDDLNTSHVLDTGTHSLSAPRVVSRGEVIYAVHEVTNGTLSSALRSCRVSDAVYTCYWVSDHPDDGVRRMDATAAVSTSGSLLVAWAAGNGGTKTGYMNGNYGVLNADMSTQKALATGQLFPPAIAVETDDGYLYIALATREADSDRMNLYYCTLSSNCSSGGVLNVNLPAAKEWAIYSKPSITANSSQALVAFSAFTTDNPSQSDIYWLNYTANGTASAVTRPYSTPLPAGSSACDPAVAMVDGSMTVGWHICGFPPARDDIYFYSNDKGARIIHNADNFAGRGGLDLAANGKYVAGVWNEVQSDTRIATWLAFNSRVTWIPMVTK